MACPEFENWLEDYDAITAAERKAVDSHLTSCGACREYQSVLMNLDNWLLSAYAPIKATPALKNRVRVDVSSMNRTIQPSFIPEVLDFVGWAALALVASFILLRFLPFQTSPSVWLDAILLTSLCAIGVGVKIYADMGSS